MKVLAIRIGAAVIVAVALTAPAAASAPAGRYTYTTTSLTVYDNQTRLTWQRTASTTFFIWADAKTYCAGVGVSAGLGGTGWRLPTKKELLTLVDYSLTSSTSRIDSNAFPSATGVAGWTATPVAGSSPPAAWFVSSGYASAADEVGVAAVVRCVR